MSLNAASKVFSETTHKNWDLENRQIAIYVSEHSFKVMIGKQNCAEECDLCDKAVTLIRKNVIQECHFGKIYAR